MFNPLNPKQPFNPQKNPFFYGWVILVAGIVGIIMTIPGQTTGVSVFTNYLIKESHLSRLDFSNTYLIGTLISASCLPLVGTLLDWAGSRIMAILACIGLSLSLVFLSLTGKLTAYLETFSFTNTHHFIIAFLLLVVGFFGIRFFAQGVLMMSCRIMISKWFNKKRGFVSGIQGIFVAFCFSIAPYLLNKLIEANAWQDALRHLAIFIGGFGTVFCWIFFRDNPERCGLFMDNLTPPSESKNANLQNSQREENIQGITKKEAIRTLAFWTATTALALHALIVTAVTFHIVDIGINLNISKKKALSIFIPIAIFAIVIGYTVGFLADRIKLKVLFIFMMLGLSLGTWSLTRLHLPSYQTLVVIGLGISSGCFGPLSTVAYPYYFGRRYLGAILGIQSMCMVLGSALGPSIFAFFYNLTQSYSLSFQIGATFPIPIIIMAFFISQKKFKEV